MPVCSPYAVFRAADLGWSASPAASATPAAVSHPAPKQPPRAAAAALLQGELFGHPPAAPARRRRKRLGHGEGVRPATTNTRP